MADVVLTAGCRDLRRRLGPMVWVVLEDLVLDAEPDTTGQLTSATSARRVAEHLDIQPGTAARALRCLRDEGLVVLAREVGTNGRFGLSAYQLRDIPGLRIGGQAQPCAAQPHMARPAVGGPRLADPRPADRVHPPPPAAATPTPPASECAPSGWPVGAERPAAAVKARRGGRRARPAPTVAEQGSLWDER